MRSRAAIGNHPLHPALVAIPIGAFVLALVGDLAHTATEGAFWYDLSRIAILVGVIGALVAAVAGFVDFFKVEMSRAGWRLAKWHMGINLTAVTLYAVSLFLRWDGGALGNDRWPVAMGLAVVAFAGLGVSGWLGGKMVFEHKVGVVENADREATEIGSREPAR